MYARPLESGAQSNSYTWRLAGVTCSGASGDARSSAATATRWISTPSAPMTPAGGFMAASAPAGRGNGALAYGAAAVQAAQHFIHAGAIDGRRRVLCSPHGADGESGQKQAISKRKRTPRPRRELRQKHTQMLSAGRDDAAIRGGC